MPMTPMRMNPDQIAAEMEARRKKAGSPFGARAGSQPVPDMGNAAAWSANPTPTMTARPAVAPAVAQAPAAALAGNRVGYEAMQREFLSRKAGGIATETDRANLIANKGRLDRENALATTATLPDVPYAGPAQTQRNMNREQALAEFSRLNQGRQQERTDESTMKDYGRDAARSGYLQGIAGGNASITGADANTAYNRMSADPQKMAAEYRALLAKNGQTEAEAGTAAKVATAQGNPEAVQQMMAEQAARRNAAIAGAGADVEAATTRGQSEEVRRRPDLLEPSIQAETAQRNAAAALAQNQLKIAQESGSADLHGARQQAAMQRHNVSADLIANSTSHLDSLKDVMSDLYGAGVVGGTSTGGGEEYVNKLDTVLQDIDSLEEMDTDAPGTAATFAKMMLRKMPLANSEGGYSYHAGLSGNVLNPGAWATSAFKSATRKKLAEKMTEARQRLTALSAKH